MQEFASKCRNTAKKWDRTAIMLNRPPISMEEDNRRDQLRQLINKGMQGSSYDWMQHNGRESHHSALREEQRGIVEASCVPFSMRDEVCDAVCDGDLKGVGVLTTRTRYSRKRHRQTPCFRPLCLSYPQSIIEQL